MEWYLTALKKYAQFSGRSRRSEYWFFVLFNIIISVGLAILDGLLSLSDSTYGIGLLGSLYSLVILVPSLAVAVRRLHDTGRSGFFILLSLIPCIGTIILIVFFAQEGNSGENEYGPDPKEME